jgi:multisubunit Na+/H+ antiporter MnhF subunit
LNLWLWAAAVLALGLLPCGFLLRRAGPGQRLLARQLAAQIVALVLVLIGIGTRQSLVLDLALAVALLASVGALLFARFAKHRS